MKRREIKKQRWAVKKWCVTMSVGMICCLTGIVATGAGVYNGGFEASDSEGRVQDWAYDDAFFRLDPAGGRNGTACLVFDGRAGENGSPLLQRIRAVPGMRYRFGCWVRTENLIGKGFGARICLQWEDADGKFLAGAYYTPHITGTTDGWRKCDGVSELTPRDAVWMTVRPEVVGPIRGKAWLDDVFLEPYETRAVGEMYCSAYRGELAEGEVTFGVDLPIVGSEVEKGRQYLFSFKSADGSSVERRADRVLPDTAFLSLPASAFPLGQTEMLFRLLSAKGKELGRATCDFTRLESARRLKVTFDRRGRAIVDGKPFFPLGMYWSVTKPFHKFQLPKISATSIVEYADSPFNTVMPYEPPTREQMDLCHANGLRVIYSLLSDFDSGDWDVTGKDPTRLHSPASRRHIEAFRNHPALLAWYVNDERGLDKLENLKGRQRTVRELDPDHPSWMCVYQYDHMRGYMPTFDVAGSDPYPIDQYPIDMCYTYASTVRDRSMGLRPFWQAPQAMDWASFRTGPEDFVKSDRMPTREEMANMTWQNIAGGANGLIYYSYTYLMRSPTTPFEKAWADIRAAAQEVKDAFDVLLSNGVPPSFACDNGALAVRTWRQSERVWALCVNTTRELQAGEVILHVPVVAHQVRLGEGLVDRANCRMRFEMKGLGRILVELKVESVRK